MVMKLLARRLLRFRHLTIMARKTVKEAVNNFADKTSMHGVPSLVRARNPRAKLFWSVVCIVAMGMFIFMLISLIIKYFSFPVIVKVDQVSFHELLFFAFSYDDSVSPSTVL